MRVARAYHEARDPATPCVDAISGPSLHYRDPPGRTGPGPAPLPTAVVLSAAMQRIALTSAAPGMVLAEPAESEQGTVVCGAGTTLTETLINRLQKFGVTRLIVEGHPVKKVGEDETVEQQLAALDRRFAAHADNELMMQLKQVFRDRIHERAREDAGDAAEPA